MTKKWIFLILILVLALPILAEDEIQIQVYPENANLWYFHSPAKGLNFYFMRVWPGDFMLTKFGPPAFQISKSFSLCVAAGPDLNVDSDTLKGMYESLTIDVVPVIVKSGFCGVFINEFGPNKDGKAVYFFRHTVTYNGPGLRWSGSGIVGRKADCFRIGPVYQFEKIQLWIYYETISKRWSAEVSFSIKI
jgi:hypothetical protein